MSVEIITRAQNLIPLVIHLFHRLVDNRVKPAGEIVENG